MKKITKSWRKKLPATKTQGQAVVEFVLVLPFLLLLILITMEVGFALYNYMTLSTANREGVRFASRARYTDDAVVGLVVSSGGLTEKPDGTFESNMRLEGENANLGVIITHIYIDSEGNLIDASTYVSGTIASANNVREPITPAHSKLTGADLATLIASAEDSTDNINIYREGLTFERIPNELIVLETFLAHDLMTEVFPADQAALTLYFRSVMRVLRDSRTN